MISIYKPNIDKYKTSAIDAVNSGWISNHGDYIEKAGNLLKSILNVKHAILMANGTCATHCLFLALKYKHPNIQKIYVPDNCYVAAHNAALMEYNKSQLEVMNMDINTWNVDASETYIKTLDRNAAVLIVHNLGNIVNVPRLKRIRPDLIFVEDNCEGLFGKYEGIYSGTSPDILCSSASFYGNKIITSGEGGAFFTNDDDVFQYIQRVYSQGMSNTRYLHNVHAYNYRMTNVEAAFLYDQFNDLDNILKNKREVFNRYKLLLKDLILEGKVKLFEKEPDTENSDWIFSIRIVGNSKNIEEMNLFFKEKEIDIRPFFYPVTKHNHLSDLRHHANPRNSIFHALSNAFCVPSNHTADEHAVAELLNLEVIMIPSSPTITLPEQQTVVGAIRCAIYDAL